MKKKLLALVLVIALAVTSVVGGTLAYLNDSQSNVNVMTLGNVDIQQIELQRAEGVKHTGLLKEGDLVPYQQGQPLYPAFPKNSAPTDYSAEQTDLLYWGPYVTAHIEGTPNGAGNGLWNDDNLAGAIDKMVFVENTGTSDCYYRTWIAFECPEGMEYSEGADKQFMMNVNGNSRFTWETVGYETIDNVRYLVMVATYNEALPAGTISRPSLLQVVMTHNATNEDVAKLDGSYEILVFTQACQTENFPNAQTALEAAFGDELPWEGEVEMPVIVRTEGELQTALAEASDAKSGSSTIYLAGDIALTEKWTPIHVNGYQGAGVVTLEGQGHTITGLTAPLFDGGFAGESGIIIKDLTIADSEIVSNGTQGAGAFISCVDSMETIVLDNCHLVNSTVNAPEARTGGLIGWTSGYSNQNDGPVKTYVTITNCSVEGCTITGTAVGGINGHAGASDWTYTTIENCTVINNELISVDDGDWRVGAVIGTANIGEVTINNVTAGGNVMKQDNASSQHAANLSDLIGRFVPGTTGKLAINGTATAVATDAELNAALSAGENVVLNDDIKTEATTTAPYGNKVGFVQNGGVLDGNGKTLSVECYGDDYGIMTAGGTIKNINIDSGCRAVMIMSPTEDVIIDNVYVVGDILYPLNTGENATVSGVDLIVTDSTFGGWSSFDGGMESASFTNCDFVKGEYGYGWPYATLVKPYINTTFSGCDFVKGYYLDLSALKAGCTVTLEGCTVDGQALTAEICGFNCDGTEAFCVELPSGRALADCVIFK